MRSMLFRVAALATAIGVAFVVATGGRGCTRTDADARPATTTTIATTATAPEASGANPMPAPEPTPAAPAVEYGVMGPSTKADPHAIRRAVNGLAGSSHPASPSSSTR
jgi:hypothetical protein